jgi:hypothetical protein
MELHTVIREHLLETWTGYVGRHFEHIQML